MEKPELLPTKEFFEEMLKILEKKGPNHPFFKECSDQLMNDLICMLIVKTNEIHRERKGRNACHLSH